MPRDELPHSDTSQSKMTSERVELGLECLAQGMTQDAAAGMCGVSRSTFQRWLRDPDFAVLAQQAEGRAEAMYTAKLTQLASQGNVQAIMFWLERRRYKVFGKKDEVRVAVEVRQVAEEIAAMLADHESDVDIDALMIEAERLASGQL